MINFPLSLPDIPAHCARFFESIHTQTRDFLQNGKVQRVVKVSRIALGVLSLAALGICAVYAITQGSLTAGLAATGCTVVALSTIPLRFSTCDMAHIALDIGSLILRMVPDDYEMREREYLFSSRPSRDTSEPYSPAYDDTRVNVGDHKSCYHHTCDSNKHILVGRR